MMFKIPRVNFCLFANFLSIQYTVPGTLCRREVSEMFLILQAVRRPQNLWTVQTEVGFRSRGKTSASLGHPEEFWQLKDRNVVIDVFVQDNAKLMCWACSCSYKRALAKTKQSDPARHSRYPSVSFFFFSSFFDRIRVGYPFCNKLWAVRYYLSCKVKYTVWK
jgi:hypothetical protein